MKFNCLQRCTFLTKSLLHDFCKYILAEGHVETLDFSTKCVLVYENKADYYHYFGRVIMNDYA